MNRNNTETPGPVSALEQAATLRARANDLYADLVDNYPNTVDGALRLYAEAKAVDEELERHLGTHRGELETSPDWAYHYQLLDRLGEQPPQLDDAPSF